MINKSFKEALRNEFRNKLRAFPLDQKKTADSHICNTVFPLPVIKKASVICSYISTSTEVDTQKILDYFWKTNKTIVVPRMRNGLMEVCKVTSLNDLTMSVYGILEPIDAIEPYGKNIDCCLIPGLAFDKQKSRLGRGKGYYDMFLKTVKATKIGLAYDFQIIDFLPKDSWDVSMDFVVTEKRCL